MAGHCAVSSRRDAGLPKSFEGAQIDRTGRYNPSVPKQLNVGFIGAGRIADLHALAYGPESRARIHTVCDSDAAIAEARAAEWGAERHATDYRELLDDPAIDAVEILLPHHLHAEVTIAALKAGKHVSVQKPMARSVRECEEMAAAASAGPGTLRVFENFRHYPPYLLARQMLDAGDIGEPQGQHITVIDGTGEGWHVPGRAWRWRFDSELCGGGPCMFDHGWHIFSLAMFMLGPVAEVMAWFGATEYPRITVDRPSQVSWRHSAPNRVGSWQTLGSDKMRVDSKYYTGDERLQLVGERGIIWVNHCSGQMTAEPPLVVYQDGQMTTYSDVEADWAASFREGGHAWHHSLLDGTPCDLKAGDALEVQRFCEAAHRSAASGQLVRL